MDDRDDRGPRGGRAARTVAGLLLLASGVLLGWLGARRLAAAEPSEGVAGIESSAALIRDVGATVLATGIIRPEVGAQVAVGSRVSGVLRSLHVTAGDRVEAGSLLAELDRVEFQTQVARAEAALAVAAAERAYAADTHERTRRLAENNAATEAELSAAKRQHEAAVAREAEAQAEVAATEVQLDYTTIRAPIAGVIGDISTQQGETVAASFAAPTFLTIVDLDRLEVWAYVDETDIGRIDVGQRVHFTVDAYADTEFAGRVIAIRPTAAVIDNVVNYITLIEIEQRSDRILRPEMTATVNITIKGRTGVLAVPNGALRRDSGGTYVLIESPDGWLRRTVEPGFRGSEYTEIVTGLREGEHVMTGTAQPCLVPAGEAR
jgi:macrolide-specific efflux system membrane fusion protein